LSFSYTFKKEDEGKTVYFAYAKPYGYQDLLSDLSEATKSIKLKTGANPRVIDQNLDPSLRKS